MLNKSKAVITGLLTVVALAAASSAAAYPQWSGSTMYNAGAMVEREGHVFQHGSGYSRGDTPYPGSAWRYGNTWDDKGAVGTQPSTKPPVSSSPSAPAWTSGSAYAKGAVVSYNGARYQANVAISASEFSSRIAPSSSSTRWARV